MFAAAGHSASMDRQMDEESGKSIKSLRALAVAEGACQRCPLYRDATQAVPGEGPKQADFVLVGEQPNDKEDLAGEPFVGPAGRILDSALNDAGIAREDTFVTNAVKHILNTKCAASGGCTSAIMVDGLPGRARARARFCNARSRVTAERSLTGKTVTIGRMRRTPVELADGTKLVVTIHPSALLRIEDEGDKHVAYHALVDDLKAARAAAGKAPAKR